VLVPAVVAVFALITRPETTGRALEVDVVSIAAVRKVTVGSVTIACFPVFAHDVFVLDPGCCSHDTVLHARR
jgi:hypothetical protein